VATNWDRLPVHVVEMYPTNDIQVVGETLAAGDSISMVGSETGAVTAQPGSLNSSGNGFSVTWEGAD
jgi:hypothetical protein